MQGISREGTLRLAPQGGSQHCNCSFLGLQQWLLVGYRMLVGRPSLGQREGARLRMPLCLQAVYLVALVTNEHPGVGSRNT